MVAGQLAHCRYCRAVYSRADRQRAGERAVGALE